MIRMLWDNTKMDSATVKASSEVATLPVSNLKNTIRKKVWKTAEGVGTARVDIDFVEETGCSALGLVEHNIEYGGTVQVQAFDNAADDNEQALNEAAVTDIGDGVVGISCTGHGYAANALIRIAGTTNYDTTFTVLESSTADVIHITATYAAETIESGATVAEVTEVLDETFDVWDPVMGWGEGGFGQGGYGGYPDEEFLRMMPRINRALFFDPTSARYWAVTINNGDQQFYLGRLFLCMHMEPEVNFEYNWQSTRVDPSRVEYSLGGQALTDIKDQYYEIQFTLKHLTEGEAWGEFLRMINWVGLRRDMILQMFDEEGRLRIFNTIYGRFVRDVPIKHPQFGRFQSSVTFRESL